MLGILLGVDIPEEWIVGVAIATAGAIAWLAKAMNDAHKAHAKTQETRAEESRQRTEMVVRALNTNTSALTALREEFAKGGGT